MGKAKCIRSFSVERRDDDGFLIENADIVIEKDTIWNIETNDFRVVGGEVRLTNDELGWLEIPKEHFEEDFEVIG